MKKLISIIFLLCWTSLGYAQLINESSELVLNTGTANQQQNASVTSDSNGNVYGVWESWDGSNLGYEIKAKFTDSLGNDIVAEFTVNTSTGEDQRYPKIKYSNQGFVFVTWMGIGTNGDWDVYGKVFDTSGNVLVGETILHADLTGNQKSPNLASTPNGDLILVWQNNTQVSGTRYISNTSSFSANFQIDSSGVAQLVPVVAGLTNNGFTVVWQETDTLNDSEIKGQVFDSSNGTSSSIINISNNSTFQQISPAVSSDTLGNVYVVWTDKGSDGSNEGIYLSVLSQTLGSQGQNNKRINKTTSGFQNFPSIATSVNGITVVSWNSFNQDASYDGIYSRVLDNNHNIQTNETRLNSTTDFFQSFSALSLRGDEGPLYTLWQSGMKDSTNTQDGDEYGIVWRSFDLEDITHPDIACKAFTLTLGPDSTATLIADSLDNGTYDANVYTLSVDPGSFTLSDTGSNNVTLTAIDPSGNKSTCISQVNIEFITPEILSYNGIEDNFCANETFNFRINTQGYWAADNQFTIQLSDENGTFTNPVVLGVVTDTSFNSLTIPAEIVSSSQYRIRVLSSNSGTTGPESGNFTLHAQPTVAVGGNFIIENGQSITVPVEITGESIVNFSLAGELLSGTSASTSVSLTPSSSGVFSVSNVYNEFCQGTSSGNIEVTFDPSPCLSNVNILEVSHYGLIKSSDVIVSIGTVNDITTYQAANSITLNPGFSTNTTKPFKAEIQNCIEE
ncbi:3-coathanger stack domain-containing protein [Jiulongibacter sediminis]|uniref:3-coathanger stack domain-containing protein n=1 Tax=Jiulongibacter sediminis TaxID=1605367 RepID=UPI0026EF03A1|nr:3-coathanger stack domain-containing protein [Jiulongibacter sediminis]